MHSILITGGAGFIGSHLVELLLENNHRVIVLDDLSTGSLENLRSIENHRNFEFVEGNICDADLVYGLAARCEHIYHLAAAVGVQLIVDNPVRTIETNISGTETVLEAANKFKRKILIASSSEVYGKNLSMPLSEDNDMVFGGTQFSRWSYACSKAIDEFLAFAFHRQYELDVTICRFFNTIGPRQVGRYGMVVPRFITAAMKNEDLIIYGSGKQSRCFCYVKDMVEAIVGLMNCRSTEKVVYNIGSTEEVTIEQLADIAIKLTRSSSSKKFISYLDAYGCPMDDMMRRVPSIERIRQATGWQPKTNLTQALQLIIENEKL